MRSEHVAFYSEGKRLAGTLHLPEGDGPWPTIVQGPGWVELRCSAVSEPYHLGFAAAGYAVMAFDTRGFGDSEGEPGWERPQDQQEDLLNAVSYARTRSECDSNRLGLFAVGGLGCGNSIYAAREEPRIKAICAMTVVSDGATWFRQMRREYEWMAFLKRVDENHMRRVLDGTDELIDPREDLMVATPERRTTGVAMRGADDARVGAAFHLASAESLMRFRPIEVVDRIGSCALLMTSVADDVVTPEDHALALYERARAPKKLIRQTNVTHYASYVANKSVLLEHLLDWYGRYLHSSPITVRSMLLEESVTILG
jgi:hypothetical protein